MLQVEGIRKVFGGNVALADVDFAVRSGEIHGLLGENGAGKSTLIKILAGALDADGGAVRVGNTALESITPKTSQQAGISFIHQDLGLITDLSIAENIAFGIGFATHGPHLPLIRWEATRRRAREVLDTMGIDIEVDTLVRELGIGAQAAVAIARALASDARVLILDEPTATLSAGEVAYLFAVLRRLREAGLAIVFVSHRMDEVFALCDRVTVLRDGRTAGTRTLADTSYAEVVQLITGHGPGQARARADDAAAGATDAALELDGVEGIAVGPVDLTVRTGEIFGLTGLAGAGQEELAEIVGGLVAPVAGTLRLFGAAYRPASPRAALDRSVAFVPSDRAGDGLCLQRTLLENLYDNPRGAGLLARGEERAEAQALLERFDVRPPWPDAVLSTLSGGNAQKVLLAKFFAREPRMLVLNEPTAGVDIGAREQIYAAIRRAAAEQDVTVLVVTSDLEEVAMLCDRAAVLYRGVVMELLEGADVRRDVISEVASQGALAGAGAGR
jgi:ribose transport system ATP-binding protein